MKQIHRLLLAVGMMGALQGCALSFDASTIGVKTSMSEPAGELVQGTEFEVSRKAVYVLWGVLRVATPSLENVVAGQLLDGSEVQNLSVKVRSRFWDVFLTVLTAGLIVPRSVTYSGVVVPGSAGN